MQPACTPDCRSSIIRSWRTAAIWSAVTFALSAFLPGADVPAKKPAQPAATLSFEHDVAPILQTHCGKCHGEGAKGGLDLRRKATILQGGDGGPAVVPGKPGESLILEMIEQKEMPPKGEPQLQAKQVELLRQWVLAGAKFLAKEESKIEVAEPERRISEAEKKFWSFQPPVRPAVPMVKAQDRVRTPIDSFLLSKLEAKGLSFNADASKRVLLRRLCFDLVGLPPTPEQIDAFLSDNRSDAYEQLVEQLLASPQYGERWGRHWLDVAGYADSDGFLEADRERMQAWRYRDYVINALNNDKPYDQFVREQIAGDEMTDWRHAAEYTPEMLEKLVATGFLRTAADPTYEEYKEKPEIYKVLADVMQITGSTFLGVTVQCARCHDHKLEPISQREYYQLQAVFQPSYNPDRWLASGERGVWMLPEAEAQKILKRNATISARVEALKKERTDLITAQRSAYIARKLEPYPADIRPSLHAALLPLISKRTEEQLDLVAKHAPKLVIDDAAILTEFPESKRDAEKLQAAIAAETALLKDLPKLRVLTDLDDKAPPTHLLRRGDFNTKGKIVDPGVPVVLSGDTTRLPEKAGFKTTGRRTAFATWLTDPKHPTTARLQVNRMWAHHFGRGLVETLDDFGHTGKMPSNSELLDWLATEFIGRGWSQKAMHRLIVTSTVYRQASVLDSAKAKIDPDNLLLWTFVPRRHQGETLRDSVLALGRRLNPEMYGPPVPVNQQSDGTVVTADNEQGRRRSVYLKVRRSQPVTMMESFDTPKMEINCARRTEAIVATQSLVLLNSPFMLHGSQAVADRIVQSAPETAQRTRFAWKLLFAREPSPTESQNIADFITRYVKSSLGDKFAQATPEVKRAAEVAAWPHVALMLLNTNEFMYFD